MDGGEGGLEIIDFSEFVKERNTAITEFVQTGKKDNMLAYCKKYKVQLPKNNVAFAGAIYKAAQQCTDIPEDVKLLAAMKCIDLGMNPYDIGGNQPCTSTHS